MNGCCVLENQAYLMIIAYTICLQRGPVTKVKYLLCLQFLLETLNTENKEKQKVLCIIWGLLP